MSGHPGGSRRVTGALEATSIHDDYGGGIVGTRYHNGGIYIVAAESASGGIDAVPYNGVGQVNKEPSRKKRNRRRDVNGGGVYHLKECDLSQVFFPLLDEWPTFRQGPCSQLTHALHSGSKFNCNANMIQYC
jgi:hypothetical protein